MSELRQNIATKEWVIIAPERSNRPEDFAVREEKTSRPTNDVANCPFCPGNEHLTPAERGAIYDAEGQWLVRAVANKYPALSPEGELSYQENGTRRWISGVGVHDVIVENRDHHASIPRMELPQVERLLRLYRRCYNSVSQDSRVELVTLFKNHGAAAGASLAHPHSQLIGTPVVPADIRQRTNLALRYYDDHRTCVYCTMLAEELRTRERLVYETEHFACFVLYAALSPFHLWLLPKRHASAFSDVTDAELCDLSKALRVVLGKIDCGLGDPDYNFVVRSRPGHSFDSPYLHWYMSIVPRVSTSAGFELGSGMFINTLLPERAADFLRGVELTPPLFASEHLDEPGSAEQGATLR